MDVRHAAVTMALLVLTATRTFAEEGGPAPADLAALEATANRGDAAAQLAYGLSFRRISDDMAKPIEERRAAHETARSWIQKAANQDHPEAVFWLAHGWYGGRENAAANYARAAELGYRPAFRRALDALLFRAGREADLTKAKRVADLARTIEVTEVKDLLETVDRCYEAGDPAIPEEDLGRFGDDEENVRKAETYANAIGVERNVRLAMALVCHGSDVPMELVGMVEALHEMQVGTSSEELFRFCRHVTSALNGQYCLAEWAADAEDRRARTLAPLRARLTDDQQAALDGLLIAADEFFRLDAEATAPAAGESPHYLDAPARERIGRGQGLAELLVGLDEETIPADRDLRAADRELDAQWSRLMKSDVFRPEGTVDRDLLREAQRRWIAYREAWAKLGKALHPSSSAAAWRTTVTRERIEELRNH